MKKSLLLPLFLLLTISQVAPGCTQRGQPPVVYMQVFFEGPNWLAGREVLHYMPAFKGKTGELVAEGADTRELSPMQILRMPTQITQSGSGRTTVTTDKGTFITDANGKTHRQTEEEIRKENQAEQDNINRGFQLLEKRARLAHEALTEALNEAAADDWEVVQMTASGTPGGLVYLLRKR